MAVVCDVSFALVGAEGNIKINSKSSFVSQANWLAIGYSNGATPGVKAAIDDGLQVG